MHITITPQRGLPGQPETTIHVEDETITVDGTKLDLSTIPEGGEGRLEGDYPILSPIIRRGGTIQIHVVAKLDDTAEPSQDGPWTIELTQGYATIPAKRKSTTVGEA